MFKKLKDKIEEEFKQAPLKFPVSVQQLAQVISPSSSVNSLSDNNASSSLAYPTDIPNVSTNFFSIGGNDDSQNGISKTQMSLENVELTATSPSNMTHDLSRSRRSSLSSVTSESSSLFPIYESGLNQHFMQSDVESEMEDGLSGQIERISKEQLHQSFKKAMNQYNKYKGRYKELMKLYKELQHDSLKTKNVLQESQDKALRRMAELREQCQLEQKAKAHLEESLRNDVEERDHVIDTLKTKITLLSNDGNENAALIQSESGDQPGSDRFVTDLKSQEMIRLRCENEELRSEVERLKKNKETAFDRLIDRCDTTIDEAAEEDAKSDNLKRKMTELKSEIHKMKCENESLSDILSRSVMADDDRKWVEHSSDDKDGKIERLNGLLLKCKEKIRGLSADAKSSQMAADKMEKTVNDLRAELAEAKAREGENALSVAENKKAIHEELNAKEEEIRNLAEELKTKESEFVREREEALKNHEARLMEARADFSDELKRKSDQIRKLMEESKAREIVSNESFRRTCEMLKRKNLEFKELAEKKTAEIVEAQRRLEERVTAAGDKMAEAIRADRQSRNRPESGNEEEKEEKIRWKERCRVAEEKLKKFEAELAEKAREKEELEKRMAVGKDQAKRTEREKESAAERERKEKAVAETKLKECLDRYNRLDEGNRNRDQSRDLNESREKIRYLEEEERKRSRELESERKKKNWDVDDKKWKEIRELKEQWTVIKEETMSERAKFAEDLENLKLQMAAAVEGISETIRADSEEELKKLKSELKYSEDARRKAEGECQRFRKEWENLKAEMKEEEDKCDGLTRECTLLTVQMDNLKKILSEAESQKAIVRKLECDLAENRKEVERLQEKSELLAMEKDRINWNAEKIRNELMECEKSRREEAKKSMDLTKRVEEAEAEAEVMRLKERELEKVRNNLKCLEEEFEEREKAFADEKNRVISENENKLNVLKCEIEFINARHEEDIGNYEENLKSEVKEANEKIAEAERTSAELVEKLERLASERDELVARGEEKDLTIASLENRLKSSDRPPPLQKFIEGDKGEDGGGKKEEAKVDVVEDTDVEVDELKKKLADLREGVEEAKRNQENEVRRIIVEYDSEIARRDKEIEFFKLKFAAAQETIERSNSIGGKKKKKEDEGKEEEDEEKGESKSEGEKEKEKDSIETGSDVKMEEETISRLPDFFEATLESDVGNHHSRKAGNRPEIEGEFKSALMKEIACEMDPESEVMSCPTPDTILAESKRQLRSVQRKETSDGKKTSSKKKAPRKNSRENWFYSGIGRLENDTEHEYLRNILYEYMMGKEQLVLAKVLSAIVKFDEEQTRNVLEKEQQRHTLFGQLNML